jgi:hypothetical protein
MDVTRACRLGQGLQRKRAGRTINVSDRVPSSRNEKWHSQRGSSAPLTHYVWPPGLSCRCLSFTVRSVIAASVSVGLAVAPVAKTLDPAMNRLS